MRRWKNVCSAPRCSANSRSTKDAFGSAAAMVTHEFPSHLYMSPPGPKWQPKSLPHPRPTQPDQSPTPVPEFRGVQFTARGLVVNEPELLSTRNSQGDSHVHQNIFH